MSPERLALAAAVALAGCYRDPCDDLDGGPPRYVASGNYLHRPDVFMPIDAPASEMRVDRDAGVVTLTRVVEGRRVVARYRILAP